MGPIMVEAMIRWLRIKLTNPMVFRHMLASKHPLWRDRVQHRYTMVEMALPKQQLTALILGVAAIGVLGDIRDKAIKH